MESSINPPSDDDSDDASPPQRRAAAAAIIAADLALLEGGLNYREAKLVAYYTEHPDLADAALRAGYARRTAKEEATQWLDPNSRFYKHRLHAAIKNRHEAMAAATGLHIYELVQELLNVIFADPLELLGEDGQPKALRDMSKRARMAIEEYEADTSTHPVTGVVTTSVKIKMRSKDKAIDKLMKYLGGYDRNHYQPAQSYVVLATPETRPPAANDPVVSGTPAEVARARNRADLERSNEWVVENDLPDPIIIKR